MPANLTPVYHAAEERYREAKTKEEKITALEEMLAVIPKHKGTDHLQGDIKRRIARLREEGDAKGPKAADPYLIPREGAGQVVFFGWPNTGKSALVGHLTRAKVVVAEYPFATTMPVSGMMPFEDIHIQLVDLPPVTAEEMPKGMAGALRSADLIAVLIDGGSDDCLEQFQGSLNLLRGRKIIALPGEVTGYAKESSHMVAIITKGDLPGVAERRELLSELLPSGWEMPVVSLQEPESLERLQHLLFHKLGVVRVYSKIPGKDADLHKPFILKAGETVFDFAGLVHRDFPEALKSAKVWGSARYPGQPVERDFMLADRDIVELHV